MTPIFESILAVAEIHAKRLSFAVAKLEPFHPFTPNFFTEITEDKIMLLDFFIHRFSLLQDIMGTKLFDMVLELSQEPLKGSGFLDKLDALERLGILERVDVWQKLRQIRNHLSHEYPDRPDLMARYLNEAFEGANTLLKILSAVKNLLVSFLPRYSN